MEFQEKWEKRARERGDILLRKKWIVRSLSLFELSSNWGSTARITHRVSFSQFYCSRRGFCIGLTREQAGVAVAITRAEPMVGGCLLAPCYWRNRIRQVIALNIIEWRRCPLGDLDFAEILKTNRIDRVNIDVILLFPLHPRKRTISMNQNLGCLICSLSLSQKNCTIIIIFPFSIC